MDWSLLPNTLIAHCTAASSRTLKQHHHAPPRDSFSGSAVAKLWEWPCHFLKYSTPPSPCCCCCRPPNIPVDHFCTQANCMPVKNRQINLCVDINVWVCRLLQICTAGARMTEQICAEARGCEDIFLHCRHFTGGPPGSRQLMQHRWESEHIVNFAQTNAIHQHICSVDSPNLGFPSFNFSGEGQ